MYCSRHFIAITHFLPVAGKAGNSDKTMNTNELNIEENKLKRTYLLFQAMIFINVWIVAVFFAMGGSIAAQPNSFSIDSVIRFVGSGLIFFVCMMSFRRWGVSLLQADNLFLIPLLILIVTSVFYSPNAIYSARAFLTILFTLGLYFAASTVLDTRTLIKTLIISITSISFLSICVYFILPDIGHASDWDLDKKIRGTRLSGITGAPNFIGFIAAVGVALSFFYRGVNAGKWGAFVIMAAVINAAALVMSDSRGSELALVVGVGLSLFTRPSMPRLLLLVGGTILAATIYFLVDVQAIMESFSRTGVSSGVITGRTEIWNVAKELIAQKPILGWGYGSSAILLPQYIGSIGFSTTHSHNMALQILLSIGYVGLFLFGALMLSKLVSSFLGHDSFKMALIYMLLLHGMVEPSVLQGVANMDTIIFALILAMKDRRIRPSQMWTQ